MHPIAMVAYHGHLDIISRRDMLTKLRTRVLLQHRDAFDNAEDWEFWGTQDDAA